MTRNSLCLVLAACAMCASGCAQTSPEDTNNTPTFGVTVVAPFGFCGRIYEMEMRRDAAPEAAMSQGPRQFGPAGDVPPDCTTRLPAFDQLHPAGQIYTTHLNVPPRDFREGFPGVSNRIEWFAIDYTTRFWIEKPGKYS